MGLSRNKIAVVIPTFNRCKQLAKILSQLLSQSLNLDSSLEIFVVVDGSKDGTIEMLETEYPDINIIKGNGNWWYTKSMNEGFKLAQKLNPQFVLTLNDDVEIEPYYLKTLLDDYYSLNNRRSIIGSMSISNEETPSILFSGIKIKNKKSSSYFPILQKEVDPTIKGIYESTELPGRGILIPNDILKELNYFDEIFPQYGSDTDFCFRARKKGINVFISWNAHVKVNLKTTRIRSQSGVNSLKIKIQDLFNIHSHSSILKFIVFNGRHSGYFCIIWKLPLFLIKYFLNSTTFKLKM